MIMITTICKNARIYFLIFELVPPLPSNTFKHNIRYNHKIQLVCCTSYLEGHGILMMWVLLLQLVNRISNFGMSEQWSM